MEPTRRDLIRISAVAVAAVPLAVQITRAQRQHQFFTDTELRLVDELTEMIIPSDDHSPGARAAKVAEYIDLRLAESFEEEPKTVWRDGLKLINTLSRKMNGHDFLDATPEQRIELMKTISKNEFDANNPEEIFFREVKHRTAEVYYTSKIGIHQEIEYKGNTILEEFVGIDAGTVPIPVKHHQA